MSQTKGNTVDKVSASGNQFLKSLLQVEEVKLTEKEKKQTAKMLTEIIIHGELTLDYIKSQDMWLHNFNILTRDQYNYNKAA